MTHKVSCFFVMILLSNPWAKTTIPCPNQVLISSNIKFVHWAIRMALKSETPPKEGRVISKQRTNIIQSSRLSSSGQCRRYKSFALSWKTTLTGSRVQSIKANGLSVNININIKINQYCSKAIKVIINSNLTETV